MGRVLQAQENKSEMGRSRRERREGESEREKERKKERERERERKRERERTREERERENTTGTLHQQALKVKYSNHHTHISNNSISCRYNLTWSPMYCTNTIWQTEMLMECYNRQGPTLAAYNKKRAQPVTTAVNHMTLQNCRYKLTCSTMYWRNKIRQTEMLLKHHNTQDQGYQLITIRGCSQSQEQ